MQPVLRACLLIMNNVYATRTKVKCCQGQRSVDTFTIEIRRYLYSFYGDCKLHYFFNGDCILNLHPAGATEKKQTRPHSKENYGAGTMRWWYLLGLRKLIFRRIPIYHFDGVFGKYNFHHFVLVPFHQCEIAFVTNPTHQKKT